MNRRTILRTTSVGIGTMLTGCLGSTVLADDQTSTELTPGHGNDTETMPESRGDEMAVEVIIENQSDHRRSGTIQMIHLMTPVCRYGISECGRPATRNIALETSFDLAPTTQQSLQPVAMEINSAGDTVDSYSVQVSTDTGTETLHGLEAGAVSIVGREQAADYPWRVLTRRYQVRVIITAMDIDIAVQSDK